MSKQEHAQAIELLNKELETNPAHEAARILLADAYEKAGKVDEAVRTWKEVMALSSSEECGQNGRRAISRLLRVGFE